MSKRVFYTVISVVMVCILFPGQVWSGTIRLNGRELDPARTPGLSSSDVRLQQAAADEPAPFVVQFDGPIQPEWLENLRDSGAEIHFYLPDYAYLVTMPLRKAVQHQSVAEVRWAGRLPVEMKIRPSLAKAAAEADAAQKLEVTILSLDDAPVRYLDSRSVKVKTTRMTQMGWQDTRVRIPASELKVLAGLDSVIHLEEQPVYRLHGERAAQTVAGNYNPGDKTPFGPGYLDWLESHDLKGGEGLIVQVMDDGLDQGIATNQPGTAHPDLLGRIAGVFNATSDASAQSIGGHGQINAGIIIGNASMGLRDHDGYLLGLGVAPEARVHGTKVFNDRGYYDTGSLSLSDLARIGWNAGARFSNNSWGSDTFGQYTADCAEFDALTRDADPQSPGHQSMTFFVSAGNSGPGQSSVGSPATGKNVISVGASENSDADGIDGCNTPPSEADNLNDLANFSSQGPTTDGRFGVTVVSVGTHVQGPASTAPGYDGTGVCDMYWPSGQQWYSRSSGTSHSSPVACGAGMVIHEFFQRNAFPEGQRHPVEPSPAFLRAVLTNTARDLAGWDDGRGGQLEPIPNGAQGWGLVNMNHLFSMKDALFSLDQEHLFTASGQEFQMEIQPADPSYPLKITLAWTDPPALPGADPTLINNLDLQVIGPEGTYLGNVFSGGFSRTGGEPDSVNNLEAVYLENPFGTYVIRVLAQNIAGDGVPGNATPLDQDFALFVWNGVQQSSRGFVQLDRPAYQCEDRIGIRVSDADLQGSGVLIISASSETGDLEWVSLTETGENTGVFLGEIDTVVGPANPGDGLLQVMEGLEIEVVYEDLDDGTGQTNRVSVRAGVDCSPPEILAATVVSVQSRRALIEVRTDEPARVSIDYGRVCGAPAYERSGPSNITTHQIELTGLTPETTYYFVVSATDIAGNGSRFPSDMGTCLEFSTPAQPDFLTEQFVRREFDLVGRTLRFIPEDEHPDGYRVCVENADVLPSDFDGATEVFLGDDDFLRLDLPPGRSLPFFGEQHHSIYLGSNGYLTFNRGDQAYLDSLTNHFSQARISVLFRDFDPSVGGRIFHEILSDRLVVTFLGVPEYDTQNENTFQAEIFFNGIIEMTWMAIQTRSGIVGLSPGNGVPPGFENSDFSATGPCLSATGELFWDRSAYRDQGMAHLELRDTDLAGQSVYCVTVETGAGDQELFFLHERIEYPGVFSGEMPVLSEIVQEGNQIIEAMHGDWIRAFYLDERSGDGSVDVLVTAEATADYIAPEILSVSMTERLGRLVRFEVLTNEAATVSIEAGTACGRKTHVGQSTRHGVDHLVHLDGLEENTVYYYTVSATDVAGNLTVADAGGECFTFTTTRSINFFSRDLAIDFQDLQNVSFLWTPNGSVDHYFLSRSPVSSFPIDPKSHQSVSLRDDDFLRVSLLNGQRVLFYGKAYNAFYIGSNGFLTFRSGDDSYNPSLARHFSQPRFSGSFQDLVPALGAGRVSYRQLSDRVVVTFERARTYAVDLENSFQFELFFDGRLRLTRLVMEEPGDVIGLSRGDGLPDDFLPTDFLAAPLTESIQFPGFWELQ